VREALAAMPGPIILVANLLTEGRGMHDFTAADAVAWVSRTIARPVDVVVINTSRPSPDILAQYEREDKRPLAHGVMPAETAVVEGDFWRTDIARHDRRRLSYAVWTVLSQRLLQ
jgi:hypothetical protein